MINVRLRRAMRVKNVVAEALAFVWGALALSFSVLIIALSFGM